MVNDALALVFMLRLASFCEFSVQDVMTLQVPGSLFLSKYLTAYAWMIFHIMIWHTLIAKLRIYDSVVSLLMK